MRRLLHTLAGRLALLQLLIYAVLLPVLFSWLDATARSNAVNTFTRNARAYSGALARELELGDVLDSPARAIVFLDGSVEGGGCVYAAMELNGRLLGSSAADTPAWVRTRGDDLEFSKSPDPVYAVAMPFRRGDGGGTLFLGFDKRPMLEQWRLTREHVVEALVVYGIASIIAVIFLARLVSRPLTQLQAASRAVARGELAVKLGTDSRMIEIAALSQDLEHMREGLVGTAEKLRAEMQQRQLEQAQRAILESQLRHEQRLATVGTLAGGVAHEFNNILVPLILYAEEALEDIGPEHPARPNVERVLRVAKRASDVVSRLLKFSRPMGERQPQSVDVAAVVNEALDLFQALVPPDIELRRAIDCDGRKVAGDSTLLNQVVLNLCTNAVQAMQGRGGTLTVAVRSRERVPGDPLPRNSARILELCVKDTGHGMDAQTRERIFEPYFTTRDIAEGSGLGLSIVHGIVTSMGGVIEVCSALSQGSEFTVVLPEADPPLRVCEPAAPLTVEGR
jgi:signal transduction histidine kinase